MRTFIKTCLSVALVAVCAGCPWFPRNYDFINADLSGNRHNDLFGGGPMADGEGESDTREVIEPDVIRREGRILYVLNQYRGLTLVDLDSETLLKQIPTYGYPRDLYVIGDRAYVLVANASEYEIDGDTISFSIASKLYVVDVSAPEAAEILGSFELNGDLVDSRLVGDVLYAVCAEYQWYWPEDGMMKTQTSSSWVSSVNVADPGDIHEVDEVSFDGMGDVIQATNEAIFVASSEHGMTQQTTITYVDIADPAGAIEVRGSAIVDGRVADRFKMDAYEGVLRVVSSTWTWNAGRRTYVTTFDLADPDHLVELGQTYLEDADGEALFATRFDGPLAYIVTFFVVDPLFVVDLSDPANPRIGENPLEVPGWSTHIEPRGDRLIALGVDDTDGRRVSCSMFDVSDPDNPALVGERVSFGGDWSWSSAYDDVKAFSVFDDVIVVPFSGWRSDFGGYDRLQFISYTDSGLEARGYVDLDGSILRSFEYDGRYYGVTTEQLATIDASDLSNPTVTHRLTLAEYVADFRELSSVLGVEIITAYGAGETIVRTVGLTAKGLGETAVKIGNLTEAVVYGESVVLVGTDWDSGSYESHYLVAVVDCSTPENPTVTGRLRIEVPPYWGGEYWWLDMPGVLAERQESAGAKSIVGPWCCPPWRPQDSVYLFGDMLVLRCGKTDFDSVFGNGEAYQGLALVDLTDTTLASTVGLAYDGIVSMNAAGGKLYVGSKEAVGPPMWRAMCAYYLRELDVADLLMGPAINVPGVYVQYDPDNDLLVVRDDQWTTEGAIESSLQTLSWNGGGLLEPIDKVDLPDNVGVVKGRGANVFLDAYDSGYLLYKAAIAPDGTLTMTPGLLVTQQWGNLLDAKGETAYVTVGSAVARYDFSGEGALVDLFETMGYPISMYFGTNYAYVPLGYAGIAQLPL
ncbi:MAG: hypothetical protein GWP08_00955 [Nitrospiraceae bacterium]|nr:hypothetical protein [Nitrospiraceae bacterium]